MACISPFYSRVGERWIPCPCGRCPPCKKRRVDGWVFRCLEEEKVSSSAFFITLTYAPAFVPISPNGYMTLDKGEFPRFMKRLRKLTDSKLKYYACGEYGSKNARPHYHAILFNVPSEELIFDAWKIDGVHLGEVHVGRVSGNSVAYVMKYIDKRTNVPSHDRDDRVPEFSLMSKGLGASYVSDRTVKFHNEDLTRNYISVDGHKIGMPRYYRQRLFDEDALSVLSGNAEKATMENESNLYRLWELKFKPTGISFHKFKESRRMAFVNRFYSGQNKREL